MPTPATMPLPAYHEGNVVVIVFIIIISLASSIIIISLLSSPVTCPLSLQASSFLLK
jgi:hypothetical protein